jgi:transposase-like protein
MAREGRRFTAMPRSHAISPFTRPRWSEADAREVIEALARSGKPVSVFAAEHGLDPQRVYLWRRRLGASAERTTFQELVVRASTAKAPFEVTLASGTAIRVPCVFDGEDLVRLLDALVRAGAC